MKHCDRCLTYYDGAECPVCKFIDERMKEDNTEKDRE